MLNNKITYGAVKINGRGPWIEIEIEVPLSKAKLILYYIAEFLIALSMFALFYV